MDEIKNFIIHKVDDVALSEDEYKLYLFNDYDQQEYIIIFKSVLATITTYVYYSGTGDHSTDWTNRITLTYQNTLPKNWNVKFVR